VLFATKYFDVARKRNVHRTFGAKIDAWLATQGRDTASFDALERLCYTGARGMGALEFAPTFGPEARKKNHIEIGQLDALVSRVLSHRGDLSVSFNEQSRDVVTLFSL